MRVRIVFMLTAVLCLTSVPFGAAQACPGRIAEKSTFLPRLPDAAADKSVVAEVEILETAIVTPQPGDHPRRLSRVRVVNGQQGVEDGQIISVVSQTHTCASDYNVEAGQTYFIAGDMNANGAVEGMWPSDAVTP